MTFNNEKNQVFKILDKNKSKRIILYGASSRGIRVFYNIIDKGFPQEQILFCDSNSELWNTNVCDTKVISPDDLQLLPKDTCIIISSNMYYEIIPSLEQFGFTEIYYFNSLLYTEQMYEKYDSRFLEILQKIGDNRKLDNEENYTLYSSLIATENLSGDIAELGVYRGGTAKLICEVKGNKNFHLFDTFEGLPKTSDNDLFVKKGWLENTSIESVKKYLKDYKNIHFIKGIFPQTTESVIDKKFSFIHIDTDLYQSTLDALKFFWPRMVTGGRIVSHDYNTMSIPGVKKAFKEFFKNHDEKLIEIADTQIMVIKY